ncbi:MAG: hypothetical protein LAT50_11960 [Ectothiorhodospiraceae bacterium]|nr:hypothetical protein [Ectothiorhodospiraceae bacterium]
MIAGKGDFPYLVLSLPVCGVRVRLCSIHKEVDHMLQPIITTLILSSAVSASHAAGPATDLHLECEDGKVTRIQEVQEANGFSRVSFLTAPEKDGLPINVMAMRYNDEDLPLGVVDDMAGMRPKAREKAIADNFERLILEETIFDVAEVSTVQFNGREYIRFNGATFGETQHALLHIALHDDFVLLAFGRDLDGQNLDLLAVALDDALDHCRIPYDGDG